MTYLWQDECTPIVGATYVTSPGKLAGTRIAVVSFESTTLLIDDELLSVRRPSGSDSVNCTFPSRLLSPHMVFIVAGVLASNGVPSQDSQYVWLTCRPRFVGPDDGYGDVVVT